MGNMKATISQLEVFQFCFLLVPKEFVGERESLLWRDSYQSICCLLATSPPFFACSQKRGWTLTSVSPLQWVGWKALSVDDAEGTLLEEGLSSLATMCLCLLLCGPVTQLQAGHTGDTQCPALVTCPEPQLLTMSSQPLLGPADPSPRPPAMENAQPGPCSPRAVRTLSLPKPLAASIHRSGPAEP